MALVSIYDGRLCVGFILKRGPKGHEAYTAAEKSHGKPSR